MLKNDALSATIWDLDVSKTPSWWCSTSASPSLSDCRPLNVPDNAPLQEQKSVNKRSARLSLTNFKLVANEEASKCQTQRPLSTSAFLSHGRTQARSHGLPSNVSSFCSVSRVIHFALLWLVLKISSVEGAKDRGTTESRSPKTLNGTPQATLRNTSWVFCFWQQFGEEKSRAVLILEIQYMT